MKRWTWLSGRSVLVVGLLVACPRAGATPHPSVLFEDRYREILRAWAEGSQEASADLATFRRSMGPSPAALRCWRKVRDHTHRRLVRRAPDAALPLAYFHLLAYADQMRPEERRLWLAESTKETTFALIDLLRRRESAGSVPDEDLAALLVTFAVRLGSHGFQHLVEESLALFRAALAYGSENATALYGAAFLEEKLGRYEEAAGHLEPLTRAWPEDREIELRLALNRARGGEVEEASGVLEALARSAGRSPWRILAYQELARLHAERDTGRALAYLDEARNAFPRDFGLAVQHASLLLRDWRRAVAETQELVRERSGGSLETARLLYERPDPRRFLEARRRLARGAGRLRPALARELDRLAADGGRRKTFRACRGIRP